MSEQSATQIPTQQSQSNPEFNQASSSTGMTASIFGATGATGKHLLSSLLNSSQYTKIHSFVRKPSGISSEKLTEHILDFEKLLSDSQGEEGQEANKLKVDSDAVFITLGTTKAAAGSASQFERIDRDYVIAAAKASKSSSSKPQTLLYLSAQMASSKSSILYPKSKGLTEEGLVKLNYSDTILFRPGFLAGAERPGQTRMAESIFGKVMGVVGKVTDSVEINVKDLASSMLKASLLQTSGLNSNGFGEAPQNGFNRQGNSNTVTVLNNSEALRLSKKENL